MSQKKPKRGHVTPENIDEARRLRELWEARKPDLAKRGLASQAAFGTEYGIGNQSAVGFFLNGETALSLKAAVAFARGLGCDVSDFSPRLSEVLKSYGVSMPFSPDVQRRISELSPEQLLRLENGIRGLLGLPFTAQQQVEQSTPKQELPSGQ